MSSPEEDAKRQEEEVIGKRIRALSDRQLVGFIDLAIEVMSDGSFQAKSMNKVTKIAGMLKRFRHGHRI
jgi:hypothetical protein